MSKLIFDLKENQLSFNSFEILNFERNKNSPSGSTLRGKGSLFYAENFSYIDKIVIKFIIKRDNTNYNSNFLSDLEKFKLLYSKYRIKGLVFLENAEIYEKIFPSIIFNKNQEFVKTAIKMLNRKESQLSDVNFEKLEDETKNLFFKLNMLDSFEQATKIFPNIKSYEFELLKEKYKNENLAKINPFLTCLHKLNFTTLPESSDGFEIEMTLGIVKDIINYERDFLNSYREQEDNFTNFFEEIENKIKSFSSEKNDLNLKFIDHDKQRMYLSETQENLNDLLNASYLLEHDVFISNEDISQLQFITHNNIAEVPIQGYSSTMKQILGVGESNLTIRLLFKNNKNESFSKLKVINNLMNKEQRQLKGTINFPLINSLDFKSVELSDFFYSNDSETDAVFATLILKVSCYSNQGVEINSFGETVDETLSANSKNRTANIPMIYNSFYHFNKTMSNQDIEKLKKIKIDADKKVEFTYEDLYNSYFSSSSIFSLWHQANIQRELKMSNLNKYQFLINLIQNDFKVVDANQKCVDIIGLLPMIDFFGQMVYIGVEGKLLLSDTALNYSDYKEKFNSVLNTDLYNKALVPIVNSMFPSIMANLEENNYYFVETVKICVLDYLVSLPNILPTYLNDIRIDNEKIIDILVNKKILSNYYKEEICKSIIKRIYKDFYNRLSDEDLINKIINSFNLNKISNEEKFSKNNQPITIEQITKGVFDSLSRIKKEIESYIVSDESKFFEVIKNQVLSISELRFSGYKKFIKNYNPTDIDHNSVNLEDYDNYFQESYPVFQKIDFISVSMFSLLMNSFGISNSYFGMIHNVAAEKIVDIGIKSAMLNTQNHEDKTRLNNIIETLFGKDFCSSNNALSFYDELTSNIALTDLGSYLDLYAKDNSGEYKAIFNVLLKSLVNDNYVSKAVDEYFKMLGEEANVFYHETSTHEEALENIYITNKKYKENGELESKEEFLEREIKSFNENVTGTDHLSNLFNAQYNNKNSYLKNFNSKDLRTERIKLLTMGMDYLNQMNQLFTPNLLQTLPTYDIYILTNQNHYNATTRTAIKKIEHYLGIDKVLSVDICFSEDTRMKTASIKVLDTSENIKPYNFKLESNLNIGLESVEDYAKNSTKTDFYSLAKQELNTGDKIVIYMGYCNNNDLVFSGQISSIQEGKVKTIECVNNTYQLINKKFNLRAAENFPIVDPVNTFKDIWREHFDVNYEILKRTKANSININQAFIPSNINNKNYNHLNLGLEQCSNYNLLFKGMAYNLDEMKEFTRANPTNLAEIKTASTDWHNLDFYQSWWRKNKQTLNSYFVQNINNVDRDISYYGVEINKTNKIIPNGSTFTIRSLSSENPNTQTQTLNDSYKGKKEFNPFSDDGVAYFAEDIDMKDLLCDLEKRSPNTYWDVLDTFEGSTLFFGRPEYNILLKKKKTFYEFSKTEKKKFLEYLEPYLKTIHAYAPVDRFLLFYNAVSSVEGNTVGTEKIESVDYEEHNESDYERAQNTIFAVTNKNLISCKVSFNNSAPNKIKIKYASTLFEKLKNFFSLNTFMSTTLYSFGSMVDLDGLENYAEKLREKVITDENIRTTRQSVESGFARLQMELESYYDGKIIITFNPKVRYRSEIVIFDSVNNIYGSVLVKDFEHKFDNRGMYTVITPMMKISTMNTSRESFSNSYWTRLFYSKNREKTKANKNFTALNNMLNSNGASIDLQLLNKLVSIKATDIPITMNNIAINHDKKTYVNLKTSAVQPLVFFPLMKRGEYLLPDKEIYSLQQRKHYELLNKYFARLGVRTKALFKFQKDYESNMDQNILQITGNYFTKRFSSLTMPKLEEIMRMNYESVVGNPKSNEIDKYRFEQVKKMMFKDLYDFKINETEVVENTFTDKNSIAFYNTKMLNVDSTDLKKENIIKVINNFDFISLVEISDYSESRGALLTNVYNLANELIEKLNERKNDNSFQWRYLTPVMIREDAMTHGKTQANEYCIQLYKLYNKDAIDKLEKLEVFPSKTQTITVDISDHNNLEKRNIVINIPVTTINWKSKTIMFYSFHNIYFGNNAKSSTDTSVYRVKSMKEFFRMLDREVKNSQFPSIIMGDFNISMFNHSVNSNQIYAPVIGEVLMIDEHGADDLTVKGSYMTAMIKPNNLTTLGKKANKNSFENILINQKTKSIFKNDFEYGVFYQAKYKSNKESIEFLSDHYPVYIALK